VGEAVVLMVDRGNCPFVTKMRHAQMVGAVAVIIVDDRAEGIMPFMSSDVDSVDVSIPAVMMAQHDGARLKSFLCAKARCTDGDSFARHALRAALAWPRPTPARVVHWSFWTSSFDEAAGSRALKRDFGAAAAALGERASLRPRFLIRSGRSLGCKPWGLFDCGKQCTNTGRYCFEDPDGDMAAGLDGRDVVTEDLRQLCVFNVTAAAGDAWRWWKYAAEFDRECLWDPGIKAESVAERRTALAHAARCREPQRPSPSGVVAAIMHRAGVDAAAVEACMRAAGGTAALGGVNHVLEGEQAAMLDASVYLLPTVIVAGQVYHGNLACRNPSQLRECGVLSAICDGFGGGGGGGGVGASAGAAAAAAASGIPPACGGDGSGGSTTASAAAEFEFTFHGADSKLSWVDAEEACIERGAGGAGSHLADVRSLADNNRVLDKCEAARCWIGLNDRNSEGRYAWTDGTLLEVCDSAAACAAPKATAARAAAAKGGKGKGGKGKAAAAAATAARFAAWAPGEPNNGGLSRKREATLPVNALLRDEDCVYMHGNRYGESGKAAEPSHSAALQGRWGDHLCAESHAYVCQRPIMYRYVFVEQAAVWAVAKGVCRDRGGRLAAVRSAAQDAHVFAACEAARCWIGLNDRKREGDFWWTGGDRLSPKNSYSHWAPDEPNNGGRSGDHLGDEDCGYIHGLAYGGSGGKAAVGNRGYRGKAMRATWGDHRCDEPMPFVCMVRDVAPKRGSGTAAAAAATASSAFEASARARVALRVTRPAALRARFRDGGSISLMPALFGSLSFKRGGKLGGRLVYGVPHNRQGCEPLDTGGKSGAAISGWPSGGPLVMMLDRGGCKFVTKVRAAMRSLATSAFSPSTYSRLTPQLVCTLDSLLVIKPPGAQRAAAGERGGRGDRRQPGGARAADHELRRHALRGREGAGGAHPQGGRRHPARGHVRPRHGRLRRGGHLPGAPGERGVLMDAAAGGRRQGKRGGGGGRRRQGREAAAYRAVDALHVILGRARSGIQARIRAHRQGAGRARAAAGVLPRGRWEEGRVQALGPVRLREAVHEQRPLLRNGP
jgi:hypothetical protein